MKGFATAAALALLAAGCGAGRSDAVHASIAFKAADRTAPLAELSLIVGGDKVSWPSLAAGEAKQANLLPGPRDDRQPILLYTFGGAKRVWEGPTMPAGAGYRLALQIGPDGSVSARHCLSPCSLD